MADGKQDHIVGVDLGGTKILAGVFNAQMKCLTREKVTTKAERGPDALIDRIARCVRDVVDECDLTFKQVRGVGIDSLGAIDPENGKAVCAGNLGWKAVPLRKELEKRLDLPVFVGNDCKVCTLGVYHVELKCKPRHVVGIFLGTGIGGGLVMYGKLPSGANNSAGEVGHMDLHVDAAKCTCGNKGCFEALASRSAIFRDLRQAVKDGEKTVLTDMLGPDLDGLRSGELRKAIRRGDKLVERIVHEAAEFTGLAVASLINILNPGVVVIGGGVMESLEEEMIDTIRKAARDHAFAGSARGVEIVASKLGDDAGITGAAVLVSLEGK